MKDMDHRHQKQQHTFVSPDLQDLAQNLLSSKDKTLNKYFRELKDIRKQGAALGQLHE